jgi:trigger factor
MYGYTLENADDPTAITLLCANHHEEKTKNLLPLDMVLAANESPINIQNGVSAPFAVHYSGEQFGIRIGPSRFVGLGDYLCALLLRDEEVIAFRITDEGQLLLNVNLRDRSGNLALSIVDNEMLYLVDRWDIKYVGKKLTVRQARGDIMFELLFEPPSVISLARANLAYDDVIINISPSVIHVTGPFIPAFGYPRERTISGFDTYGVRYGLLLDCTRPVSGGVGARL